MATVIAPMHPGIWHDLAQEGWVAMWRALRAYDPSKGALPSWLTTAAKLRMRDVYRRDTWTGTPTARGHTREHPAIPVDTDDEYITVLLGRSDDIADRVAQRYHDGEIADAINSLPPDQREYVVLRFWGGLTYSELDKKLGRSTGLLWKRAKPALEKKLAHLK